MPSYWSVGEKEVYPWYAVEFGYIYHQNEPLPVLQVD
jgi:hypothetical protein